MSSPIKVVAYVPDLMDKSRFGSVSAQMTFVSKPEELTTKASEADLIVVDLGRPGVLDALTDLKDIRTIGFLSHIDTDLREAALAVGVDQVVARSRFFSQINDLVT